jgi:hypothetical protein
MRRIAALVAAVVLVLVLLVVAQVVLPGIAAQRIRDQLSKSGKVIDVQVSAFPAIELLWHQADSVKVRMASYQSNGAHLSRLLAQSADAGSLDASAQVMTDGLLTLRNATLSKRGNTLTGSAQVQESDLTHAIPAIQSVTPIASSGGTLTLRGTANLPFIGAITVPFVVQVARGTLLAAPDIPLVGGLATLQLFSDPHVYVQSVSAASSGGGFQVSARGTLK